MRYWFWVLLGLLLTGCTAHSQSTIVPRSTAAPGSSVSASPSGSVNIVAIHGAKPGDQASVTALAAPDTRCAITYTMPDGKVGRVPGLNPKTTDSTGRVTWTWIIPSTTSPGIGNIGVECNGAKGAERILIGVGE